MLYQNLFFLQNKMVKKIQILTGNGRDGFDVLKKGFEFFCGEEMAKIFSKKDKNIFKVLEA